MKIWKAELKLYETMEEDWATLFTVKLQSPDFKLEAERGEWVFVEGWTVERIPVEMMVETTRFGSLKVTQGFDRELSEEELVSLKATMNIRLQQALEQEKERWLATHQKKVVAIETE